MQIALGVQTHHLYRSRFIEDTLFEMGFCSSYGYVRLFEKKCCNCVPPDILRETVDPAALTVLFAAGNVDHIILTIDGKGTFPGMGWIAASTPGQITRRVITSHNISDLSIDENTFVSPNMYVAVCHFETCRNL